MLTFGRKSLRAAVLGICLTLGFINANAEAGGASTSVNGTVLDPSGAVVAKATVEIHNPVSAFARSTTTDSSGRFSFANVPVNPYHLSVTETGFAPYAQDIDVRSAVPLNLTVNLQVVGSAETVTVQGEAGDLLENDSTFHTDVDRTLFDRLPLESLFVGGQFPCHACVARGRCRFQWPLSWIGRPC